MEFTLLISGLEIAPIDHQQALSPIILHHQPQWMPQNLTLLFFHATISCYLKITESYTQSSMWMRFPTKQCWNESTKPAFPLLLCLHLMSAAPPNPNTLWGSFFSPSILFKLKLPKESQLQGKWSKTATKKNISCCSLESKGVCVSRHPCEKYILQMGRENELSRPLKKAQILGMQVSDHHMTVTWGSEKRGRKTCDLKMWYRDERGFLPMRNLWPTTKDFLVMKGNKSSELRSCWLEFLPIVTAWDKAGIFSSGSPKQQPKALEKSL